MCARQGTNTQQGLTPRVRLPFCLFDPSLIGRPLIIPVSYTTQKSQVSHALYVNLLREVVE